MPETPTPPYPQRSNAAKRDAVLRLLHDPDWHHASTRAIARQAGVDHKAVATWWQQCAGDFPTVEQTVPCGDTTDTQAAPVPPCLPLLTGDTLYAAGLSVAAIQRLMARLQALPPGKRQQAQRLLQELLL